MVKKERKHYRKGFWAKLKKVHYEDLYVDLGTLSRVVVTDNEGNETDFEYEIRMKEVRNGDLPRSAVHRTGKASEVIDVQMEPRFPTFELVDEDGVPLPDHNEFTAQGYNAYARDDRLDKAERSLEYKGRAQKFELQKLITFGLVALVVIGVVAWYVMR